MSGADAFGEFFQTATGQEPYDYQRLLAGDPAVHDAIVDGPKSQAMNVPTGAVKTAAAARAWPGNHCGHPGVERRRE